MTDEKPPTASGGSATVTQPPPPGAGFDEHRSESLVLRLQHVLHASRPSARSPSWSSRSSRSPS